MNHTVSLVDSAIDSASSITNLMQKDHLYRQKHPFCYDYAYQHFLKTQHISVSETLQIIECADVVLTIIQNEQFCYISSATERVTGYSKNELFLHPDFGQLRSLNEQHLLSSSEMDKSRQYHEVKFITKYGNELWFDCSVKPMNGTDQSTKIVTAIDVTRRKQSEMALRIALEEHEKSTEFSAKEAANSTFPNCPPLAEVFAFIEANYHKSISLNDVAEVIGYSPAYLTDWVRRLTGQPLNRWIVERRMAAACSLLQKTNQSVEAIAETVGYQNTGHFFRQFRQHHGTTPLTWRKAQVNALGRQNIAQATKEDISPLVTQKPKNHQLC